MKKVQKIKFARKRIMYHGYRNFTSWRLMRFGDKYTFAYLINKYKISVY